MQLNETQIVIRERPFIDILDLSLRVSRAYAGPLCVALLAGIVPFFVLNAWLLSRFVKTGLEMDISGWYGFWLVILVVWEIPLATAPATLLLGQVLFESEPSPGRVAAGRVVGDLRRVLPQWFFYNVLVRPFLVLPVFTWIWLFSSRAYLGEVILLERNPFRQTSPERPSTSRRARALHSSHSGDLLSRWLASLIVGILLYVVFLGSIWIVHGFLFDGWDFDALIVHYAQLALWLVVGFFTVVRFLSYLDLRIRREGWEVELLLRSEHARLAKTPTTG
ncbi:MAG: hypothetical protein U9N87_14840 [Planctomycetota bacterium]|nr:hypothetical protein [Planctomycetota bacterium]